MLRCTANVLEKRASCPQVNQGKMTAGVDQVVTTTPEERGALCRKAPPRELHKVHPVRRVYIPKKRGNGPSGFQWVMHTASPYKDIWNSRSGAYLDERNSPAHAV